MIFRGFPGVLSFFQVFQVKWEPCITKLLRFMSTDHRATIIKIRCICSCWSFAEKTSRTAFYTKTEKSVLLTDLDSSSYQPRLTASSAILKPIFAKKLLQLGDFALQQQCFLHVIPMETLTGYNLT